MEYIFFLGRTPALSLAEIRAMLEKYRIGCEAVLVESGFLILKTQEPLPVRDFFVQMGGTLKMAEVLGRTNAGDVRAAIVSSIKESLKEKPGKKSIGYSIYFTKKNRKEKEEQAREYFRGLFSKIKRDELGDLSIRIVYPLPGESALSTATVFNNRLPNPGKGMEFDIIMDGRDIILGRTLIVQDIEPFACRGSSAGYYLSE